MSKSKTCVVKKLDCTQETLLLQAYPRTNEESRYEHQEIETGIGVLTLSDFWNEQAILELFEKHQSQLEALESLIIDVRENDGGSDVVFFSLLPYLFAETISIKALFSETVSVNYTPRNCDGRLALMEEFLPQFTTAESQNSIWEEIARIKENYGKGFVSAEETDEGIIEGKPNPKRIVVLSDRYCVSSGDSFVATCKKSPKVTVMGRNTLGVTDYSNLTQVQYDDFALRYPTSRVDAIDEGKGINGIGVAVDIEIPWTPEHLQRDIDMEKAVAYLKKQG